MGPNDGEQTPPRVAVVPLFYGRHDVVADCLKSLIDAKIREPFSIFAIENPSEHSKENRALLNSQVDAGEIEGVFLPARNAVFNSLLCALTQDIFRLWERFDFIVLSDGDIRVMSNFIEAQFGLLNRLPEISSASIRVDIRAWDSRSKHFPAAIAYAAGLLSADAQGADYVENAGGFWMRMFRARDLERLVWLFDRNGFRLRDSSIDQAFRTFGMYPAACLATSGIELPNGPYFAPAEETKQRATKALKWATTALQRATKALQREADFHSLWNHDVEPGGVYRLGGGRPLLADFRLTTPSSPETHLSLADLPARLAAQLFKFEEAGIDMTLDWEAMPEGLVLTPDPRLPRVFETEGGGLVVPFQFFESATDLRLRLKHIRFDTRPIRRLRRVTIARLFPLARRLLAKEGQLVIDAVDWTTLSRKMASLNARLEQSLLTEDETTVRRRARRAALVGREIEQRDLIFDLGTIVDYAFPSGFVVKLIERSASSDEGPGSIRYILGRRSPPTDQPPIATEDPAI